MLDIVQRALDCPVPIRTHIEELCREVDLLRENLRKVQHEVINLNQVISMCRELQIPPPALKGLPSDIAPRSSDASSPCPTGHKAR